MIQPGVRFQSRYVDGFIESLCRSCTNLRVVSTGRHRCPHTHKTEDENSLLCPGRRSTLYMRSMVHNCVPGSKSDTRHNHPRPPRASAPRVGLVNRKNNRILMNACLIQQAIDKELGIPVDSTYFEDKSFLEQARFFREHQIIVSPHGAQLCSIPLAPDNACIIECCHDEWHPTFYFPGLSFFSGKVHVR